jgi:hypothetical protein
MPSELRELGPEMKAEGWYPIGGDWIMWAHEPTRRVIVVDGPIAWEHCHYIPHWGEADPAPDCEGYLVKCYYADEHGNPGEGDCTFVVSYAQAVKMARRIREDILAERPVSFAHQLTLDDVLEKS